MAATATEQRPDDPLLQVATPLLLLAACVQLARRHLLTQWPPQYIVLRGDLWRSKGWPLGSVVTQARSATARCVVPRLRACAPGRRSQGLRRARTRR